MILCSNPLAQYQAHKAEIDAAIQNTLIGGWYILGEETRAFEREFAAYIGREHGIGVGNGTEALHLALAACGIGPGDEVITVAHTAVATISAIESVGATPVLVDIEPDYFTLDPAKLEQAITSRTKAVIPVHIYGQPADLEPILAIAHAHKILVIEDCAQAHGAMYHGKRVGSWGDMACFSFYPTKNLGALGDGGLVVTDNPDFARRARALREYGWEERYISAIPGWNTRLDEIQSAVLRVKLRYLDADNASRRKLAAHYTAGLGGTPLALPRLRSHVEHVYHLYVIRSAHRVELQSHLKEKGVNALVHYPMPVHLQPAYLGHLRGADHLPVTEEAARTVLSLPIYPELTEKEVQTVIEAVVGFDK